MTTKGVSFKIYDSLLRLLAVTLCIAVFAAQGVEGQCTSDPNCMSCTATPGSCTGCVATYGLDASKTCVKCDTNAGCDRCSNLTVCERCKLATQGPDRAGVGTCSNCAANCRACRVEGGGFCDANSCNTGYALNAAAKTCTQCTVTNCGICDATTPATCTTCATGYSLINGACVQCGLKCRACKNNPGACDPGFCDSGYATGDPSSPGDFSCNPCTANCTICNDKGPGKCDDGKCRQPGFTNSGDTCIPSSNTSTVGITTGPTTIAGTGTTAAPVPCTSVSDCVSCPTAGVCTKCEIGYGIDAGKCTLCSTKSGCAECDDLTKCTKCNSTALGPDPSGGTCSPCAPNCRVCPTSGSEKCDSCRQGYGLSPTQTCEQCAVANCSTCTSGSCQACMTGFGLMQGPPQMCGPCGPNCRFCNVNPGQCDPAFCNTGYTFQNDTKTCLGAETTTTASTGSTAPPVPCSSVSDCLTCPTFGVCSKCAVSYGIDAGGKCTPCETNAGCAECDNLTVCTKCKTSSLGPDKSGVGTCSNCSDNCRTCAVNGGGSCDSCKTGFDLQPDKTCAACPLNCGTCPGGKCTVCMTGYGLVNTTGTATCEACGSNCRFCNANPGKCDPAFCNPGYTFINDTKECFSNSTTTAPPVVTTVPPPPCTALPNCAVCVDTTVCTKCIDTGYGFVDGGRQGCDVCSINDHCTDCMNITQCTVCDDSEYGPKSDGSGDCGFCDPHCARCAANGAGFCDAAACDNEFALAPNNTCAPCAANCPSCTNAGPGGCDTCLKGQGLTKMPGVPATDCAPCGVANCAECYANNTQCEVCQPDATFKSATECASNASTTAGTTMSGGTTVTSVVTATPSVNATAGVTTGSNATLGVTPTGVTNSTAGITNSSVATVGVTNSSVATPSFVTSVNTTLSNNVTGTATAMPVTNGTATMITIGNVTATAPASVTASQAISVTAISMASETTASLTTTPTTTLVTVAATSTTTLATTIATTPAQATTTTTAGVATTTTTSGLVTTTSSLDIVRIVVPIAAVLGACLIGGFLYCCCLRGQTGFGAVVNRTVIQPVIVEPQVQNVPVMAARRAPIRWAAQNLNPRYGIRRNPEFSGYGIGPYSRL